MFMMTIIMVIGNKILVELAFGSFGNNGDNNYWGRIRLIKIVIFVIC